MSEPQLVAILKRAIPVDDYSTHTLTRVVPAGETVADLMAWAERLCGGATAMIRLEITKETP